MKSNTNYLTLAFLFISITCFAQSSKVNFGFEVYTNFADRMVDNEVLSDVERPNLNASFGLVMTYRVQPKLSLVSGFTLLNKGYQVKQNSGDLRWGLQHDGNGGFDPDVFVSELADAFVIKYNYYILSIPLNVRYAFGESLDEGWYVQGGIAPAFYWFDRAKIIKERDGEKEVVNEKNILDNARTVNFNINLGLGYTFLLKNKFQISVGPSFEYMPFNIVKDAAWKSSYYSYGLTTRFMVL